MAKDRDRELEDIQRELEGPASAGPARPFLYRPEQLDVGSGTLCFMDGARRCGADCVAFNAEEGLDENGDPVDNPNKCLVLNYMGQQGSAALSILALNRKAIKHRQDEERAAALGVFPPRSKT